MITHNTKASNAPLAIPNSGLGRDLFAAEDWQDIADALRLSPREFQIVQGVFDDKKKYAIAFELGISKNTVNTYMQRLYRKLQVVGRVQLILKIVHTSMIRDTESRFDP